ncbi:MAG: IS66 family insertion sequence element accessory protein TnpB [Clostridiales bacterium]|nr:IS66 family insertion sequence element accessory protein TnpB [Clostridiales bacterium]
MMGEDGYTQVHLAVGATDLRKGIEGLALIVAENFKLDPFSRGLFVFCNSSKDKVKILKWDDTGFWLYYKRLEKSRFRWPEGKSVAMAVSGRELRWLLDGLALSQKCAHRKIAERAII